MPEIKRAAMPIKWKNIDTEGGRRLVSGYYTAFGNEDSDGDIAVKGMTTKSVNETGPHSTHPRIKHFLNHDVTHPLGRLTEMGEDEYGAWYTAEIGKHQKGQDYLDMLDSGGIITEHSYGLRVIARLKSDQRMMAQVDVWETSPLTHWGANPLTPLTSIGKSMSKEDILNYWGNKVKALEKFCRNSTASDETNESLLIEIKYLTQHIIDLTTTTPAAEKAQETPGTQDYSNLLTTLQTIKF